MSLLGPLFHFSMSTGGSPAIDYYDILVVEFAVTIIAYPLGLFLASWTEPQHKSILTIGYDRSCTSEDPCKDIC